ncbi:MAG: TetR/AcrR family transcriptional regulator [Planctomycetota bacterium]
MTKQIVADKKANAAQQRANEIYQAAARAIYINGFDRTSMNDIADSVGLTKAGLYYYIRDKQDLLFQITQYAMDQLEDHVITPAREIADHEERLRFMIRKHASLVMSDEIGAVSILSDETERLVPENRKVIDSRKNLYYELVRDTLKGMKKQKKIRDLDPTVIAFNIFGAILFIPRWYKPSGRLRPKALVDQIESMMVDHLIDGG